MGRFRKISVSEEVYNILTELRDSKGFTSISETIAYLANVYKDYLSKLELLISSMGTTSGSKGATHSSIHATESSIGATTSSTSTTTGSTCTTHATVSSKVSRRRTMLDILRDVKVQLLSEVGPRDPDRFVARARSLGAVVIEGGKDVALVDPDFWAFFKENLHNLPKRIEDVRDVALRKLAMFMREEGLIYYDAIKKRWLFVDNTVAIG